MNSQFHIYFGSGKGKTTAAVGLLIRFLGSGGKACLIQFDKGGVGIYHERALLKTIPGLTLHPSGLARFDAVAETFRFENEAGDFEEAQRGLKLAREAFRGGFGLVILDEALSLPLTGLVSKDEIMDLVSDYESLGKPCELVMTGHQIWGELEAKAGLITEMRKKKHYFDQKLKARKGIEY